MRVFKIDVGDKEVYPLNIDTFDMAAGRRRPWFQKLLTGRTAWFAVCPGCENPIRLFGMFFGAPYGKHFVPRHGLLTYPIKGRVDEAAKKACPYYRSPRKKKRNQAGGG